MSDIASRLKVIDNINKLDDNDSIVIQILPSGAKWEFGADGLKEALRVTKSEDATEQLAHMVATAIATKVMRKVGIFHNKFNSNIMSGIEMIIKERERQLRRGFTPQADFDKYKSGELLLLAEFLMKQDNDAEKDNIGHDLVAAHGFKQEYISYLWTLPYTERLDKAGALIAAEIDRYKIEFAGTGTDDIEEKESSEKKD